jgi:hypothetical protein
VRLTISLHVGAKYLGCVVCRFHIAADAGSAPYQKPVSINLQKWFLSPTRLNFGFITKRKLTVVLITPSSWGSQLVRQHRTIRMADTVARFLQCGRWGFTGVIQARPGLCGLDLSMLLHSVGYHRRRWRSFPPVALSSIAGCPSSRSC